MTKHYIKRITAEFTMHAGEPISIQVFGDIAYGFGSELGCLRIFAAYNSNGFVYNKKARVGYSDNFKSWYFSLMIEI